METKKSPWGIIIILVIVVAVIIVASIVSKKRTLAPDEIIIDESSESMMGTSDALQEENSTPVTTRGTSTTNMSAQPTNEVRVISDQEFSDMEASLNLNDLDLTTDNLGV